MMQAARSRSRSPGHETISSIKADSIDSPALSTDSRPSILLDSHIRDIEGEMTSTITVQEPIVSLDKSDQHVHIESRELDLIQDDDRSSSLSELEDDGTEDPLEPPTVEHSPEHESEYDTEAETERLERTPQKLNAIISALPEKSPSKLAYELQVEEEEIPRPEHEELTPIKQPLQANGAIRDGEESPSRKRKRSESAVSSLSDTDEPLAKRANSARYQSATAGESTESLPHKDTNAPSEEDAPPVPAEDPSTTALTTELGGDVAEPITTRKGRKGRKGKRKGRWAAQDDDGNMDGAENGANEDMIEDEDEDSNRDEEIAKKKLAMEAFAKIEKEFTAFREQHTNQQLQQITHELELLNQSTSTHPEYSAILRCIDDYRDQKIHHQNIMFKYKYDALQIKTIAERQQLHSQYFQEVRDIREKMLEESYQSLYALQKDRRRWGADDQNYTHLYQPKRAQQISNQAAYNLEVSILSGVAKYVGFPAAPVLPKLVSDDVDTDFKLMKIPDRPLQPRISLRDAEREAADNSFFDQNPWANPPRPAMLSQTPQTRIVSNGSTVDGLMSAPNSQHPTPHDSYMGEPSTMVNGDHRKYMSGGIGSKMSAQLDSSPITASASHAPAILSATTFAASSMNGHEKSSPAPPAISLGGPSRFS